MFFVDIALLALYASFVVSFCVLLFIQFRMTLMIWQFIYGSVGLRLWHALRPDGTYIQQFEAFRKSASFVALKLKWYRAGLWVLGSFVLLFCTFALISSIFPTLVARIWLLM